MRIFYRFVMAISVMAALYACQKESVPAPEENPQEVPAAFTPDVRATAAVINDAAQVMAEDQEEVLEKILYSFEAGKDSTHLYIEVTRGENCYVSGELGIVPGERRKELDVDIMVGGVIPIAGTVDLLHVARYYAQARLSPTDEGCQKNLDKANEGINILVAEFGVLELAVTRDEENKRVIDLYLVNPEDPEESRASLSALLAFFLQ